MNCCYVVKVRGALAQDVQCEEWLGTKLYDIVGHIATARNIPLCGIHVIALRKKGRKVKLSEENKHAGTLLKTRS